MNRTAPKTDHYHFFFKINTYRIATKNKRIYRFYEDREPRFTNIKNIKGTCEVCSKTVNAFFAVRFVLIKKNGNILFLVRLSSQSVKQNGKRTIFFYLRLYSISIEFSPQAWQDHTVQYRSETLLFKNTITFKLNAFYLPQHTTLHWKIRHYINRYIKL